jgi:hypothetical protein
VGDEPEPMAIGWHPYFAIPSGDRKQARLLVPAEKLALVNNYDDVFPTGKLVPVKSYEGGKYDYNAKGGKPLGDDFLDDNFSTLKRTGGKVDVQLTDPAANYGIHILGISPEIKTVQVYAPPPNSSPPSRNSSISATLWQGMARHGHRHGHAQAGRVGDLACPAGAVYAGEVNLSERGEIARGDNGGR